MDPLERDLAHLWDIRDAAQKIMSFVEGVPYHKFEEESLIQSAVEMQLIIIGEAARKLSAEFREIHPKIPWRSIIGLRNILTHEYGEVRVDRIWLIVSESIPELVEYIDPLIPPIVE